MNYWVINELFFILSHSEEMVSWLWSGKAPKFTYCG